eukprot:m51a1_g9343 putative splicing arginine serine-rich 15 isoform x4 (640) ;mRNA; r:71010-73900
MGDRKGDVTPTAASAWEQEQEFQDELNSVLEHRPPITASKVGSITRLAAKSAKYYKHVVHKVEKLIARAPQEHRLSILYVVDSICRYSRSKFAAQDPYIPRFSTNMRTTVGHVVLQGSTADRDAVRRVLDLWTKNAVFAPELIAELVSYVEAVRKGNAAPPLPPPSHSAEEIREEVMDLPTPPGSPQQPEQAQQAPPPPQQQQYGDVNGQWAQYAYAQGQFYAAQMGAAAAAQQQGWTGAAPVVDDPLLFDYGEDDDDEARVRELQERVKKESQKPVMPPGMFPMGVMQQPPPPPQVPMPGYGMPNQNTAQYGQQSRQGPPMPQAPPQPQLQQQQQQPSGLEFLLSQMPGASAFPARPPQAPQQPQQQQQQHSQGMPPPPMGSVSSTTLWVGGLPPTATRDVLRSTFSAFGTVAAVKHIGDDQSMAFVTFLTRAEAEAAKAQVHEIEGNPVKVGWGRGSLPQESFDKMSGQAIVPTEQAQQLEEQLQQFNQRQMNNERGGFSGRGGMHGRGPYQRPQFDHRQDFRGHDSRPPPQQPQQASAQDSYDPLQPSSGASYAPPAQQQQPQQYQQMQGGYQPPQSSYGAGPQGYGMPIPPPPGMMPQGQQWQQQQQWAPPPPQFQQQQYGGYGQQQQRSGWDSR